MAEQERMQGTLVVTAKKAVRLKFTNRGNKSLNVAAAPDQLSADLRELSRKDVTKLDGVQVEFELAGPNKAVRLREPGKSWTPPQATKAVADKRSQDERRGDPGRGGRGGGPRPGETRPVPDRRSGAGQPNRPPTPGTHLKLGFHHAYNFIPTPPRTTDAPEPMRDRLPAGHHHYQADLFSGWIDVCLATVTPLLIPDAAQKVRLDGAEEHTSFPLRTGPDGRPCLPPTSIKGMLRSAFEAVTDSRLGVFAGHHAPLAFRMPVRDGLKLVPAIVKEGQIRLLTGTSKLDARGRQPVYAAWLHKDGHGAPSWGGLDQHGRAVWAYVTLWEHRRFRFWNVVELQPLSGSPPHHRPTDRRPGGRARQVRPVQGQWVAGYVCITGLNIDRKHDERVFFTVDPHPPETPLSDRHRQQWRNLIANYQEIHAEEIRKGKTGPPALRRSKWSRHVVGGPKETEFTDGTLCYADVSYQASRLDVHQVYPVNISRKLFSVSPEKLLEDTGRLPAERLEELSPADRVFGWVHQKGRGAYRGNLRIGAIRCETSADEAIEHFGHPGVPLAIPGAAKPQQARFYVARSPAGEAQPDGISPDEASFSPDKGLRGIKVYPHHHGPPDDETSDYWADPLDDRTQRPQAGWCQEYRRPTPPPNSGTELRDDQNRSIQAWVRPKTVFAFRLHVTNLSRFELGALLWLLSLERQQHHRLGGGKPLGFGSVRLEIRGADLRDGQAWKAYYRSLLEPESAPGRLRVQQGEQVSDSVQPLIRQYQQTMMQAYSGREFPQIPSIAAFLRAAEGYRDQKPLHYPRIRQSDGSTAPDPTGQNFQWFGENERQQGLQRALPDLEDPRLLPYYEGRSRTR